MQGETLDTLKEGVAVFGSDGRLKLSQPRLRRHVAASTPQATRRPARISTRSSRPAACSRRTTSPGCDIRGAVAGPRRHAHRPVLPHRAARRLGARLRRPAAAGRRDAADLRRRDRERERRARADRANEALERASRLRDEFVHHVSYELRSPLTNIIGFTQLLGDETVGALNPRQREYADHIMRSSAALLAIINDILDLASIDTGSLELVPRDRRHPRDHRGGGARHRGPARRIARSRLDDRRAGRTSARFVADGKRVRQILFNLLSNAVGFSAAGPDHHASRPASADGEVIFEVQDEGRGIPPEVTARVFERFESHTLGTRHRGVGLGLSIVRSFVELHGGRIELDLGAGTGHDRSPASSRRTARRQTAVAAAAALTGSATMVDG